MVRECFGVAAASNIDDIKPDHLPAILIVSKTGSSVEVKNIIQGQRFLVPFMRINVPTVCWENLVGFELDKLISTSIVFNLAILLSQVVIS